MIDFLSSIGTTMAIKGLYSSLKDYFDVGIRKTKKRVWGEYVKYDFQNSWGMEFWQDFLQNDFNNPKTKPLNRETNEVNIGDMIEIENANITRWVPFFPGKFYSKYRVNEIDRHLQLFPPDSDFGMEEELVSRNDSLVLSGCATSRLSPMNKQYLLNGCGEYAFGGIPLLITEKMYEEKLQSLISRDGGVNGKITGILCELPKEWDREINKSPLDKVNKDVYKIPRIVLKVEKISQIGTSDNIVAHAWTMYSWENKMSAFMSSFFNPLDKRDINSAVNMIANYKEFLNGDFIGGDWTNEIEFDELNNWFKNNQYQTYNADSIELFVLYYTSNMGRPKKPDE